ncbi:ATP-binding protein, partial [Patescibacteria group bacterium]|nr:ATP-binding protein [Patescibacteria group bacterium]
MIKTTQNFVKRTIFPEIAQHLKAEEITLIIGPRQVGKTTLLFQLKDYLIKHKHYSEKNILFFNLDLIDDFAQIKNQTHFIHILKESLKFLETKPLFVFIDEAQRIENAGIFFKGIYDLNLPIKFILTGSSALEIKDKIHESLTGRKRLFYLYPFTFYEYLKSKDNFLAQLILEKNISSYRQGDILNHLFNFIVYGGYPKTALEKNPEEQTQFLKEIHSSYIEKDIIGFLKIKDPLAFIALFNILAGEIGQLVNLRELSNTVNIVYRTLEKYISTLEKTFVVKRVLPFFKNRRKELTKIPKIYFLDAGLRNFALKSFTGFETRQDKGALLENFIFSEIYKQTDLQLHFWRTKEKAEVDFVLTDYVGIILPIEVKAVSLKYSEISRSFRSFITRYRPKQAIIVNLGFQGKTQLDQTEIIFIHPYEISKA